MFVLGCAVAFMPYIASASGFGEEEIKTVHITNPEAVQAYEAVLDGGTHVYKISEDASFRLTLGVFVPNTSDHKQDIMVAVRSVDNPDTAIAILNGVESDWTPVYDDASGEQYAHGPSFSKELAAGEYEVHVWSSNNDSTYLLMFGEDEQVTPAPVGSMSSNFPSGEEMISTTIFVTIVSGSISAIAGMLWMMKRREGQII